MPSHTISVQVENEFGVLARVAGLFSSRGYNIESLTVNEDPLDPTLSRITLVTSGDEQVLEQINKQLNKLVSVIKVTDFKEIDAIDREMVLIKVAVDERNRSELDAIVAAFRAHVVDIGPKSTTIEVTGDQDKMARSVQLGNGNPNHRRTKEND
jgi:acetolactate synthase-1/3 small subunit